MSPKPRSPAVAQVRRAVLRSTPHTVNMLTDLWHCLSMAWRTAAVNLGTPVCPSVAFEVGLAVSASQPTLNGVTPLAFKNVSGALPAGLSISATTGAITGTPVTTAALKPYTFAVNVTDAIGQWRVSSACSGTVAATVAATCPPSSVYYEVSAPFSYAQVSPGGVPPYAYSVSRLPTGLSINAATGAITGTPTATGTVSYIITVRDNVGVSKPSPTCGGTGSKEGLARRICGMVGVLTAPYDRLSLRPFPRPCSLSGTQKSDMPQHDLQAQHRLHLFPTYPGGGRPQHLRLLHRLWRPTDRPLYQRHNRCHLGHAVRVWPELQLHHQPEGWVWRHHGLGPLSWER